jgi:hypothetical protein
MPTVVAGRRLTAPVPRIAVPRFGVATPGIESVVPGPCIDGAAPETGSRSSKTLSLYLALESGDRKAESWDSDLNSLDSNRGGGTATHCLRTTDRRPAVRRRGPGNRDQGFGTLYQRLGTRVMVQVSETLSSYIALKSGDRRVEPRDSVSHLPAPTSRALVGPIQPDPSLPGVLGLTKAQNGGEKRLSFTVLPGITL